MEVNIKEYQLSLYDFLCKNKERGTETPLSLAQLISASVPDYLGHAPDLKSESEKEIYQYARRLMNDVLRGKIDYNQLTIQLEKQSGITKGYTETRDTNILRIVDPTPLMESIMAGNYREFKRLIKNGVDVNETRKVHRFNDGSFSTHTYCPLTLAMNISKQPYLYVKSLIEAGACISDGNDSCFLFYSKDYLNLEMIETLKKVGNISLETHLDDGYNHGDTVLTAMMRDGCYNSAKALIQAGANVNARNFDDLSVLYYAVEGKNYPMTKLLIELGADIDKQIKKMIDKNFEDKPFSRKKLRLLIKKTEQQKEAQEQQKKDITLTEVIKNLFSGGRR